MGIYMRISAVYGDYSYSHTATVERSNKFRHGRESTKHLVYPGSARVAPSE